MVSLRQCWVAIPREQKYCSTPDQLWRPRSLAGFSVSLKWSANREVYQEVLPEMLPWERFLHSPVERGRSDRGAGQGELDGALKTPVVVGLVLWRVRSALNGRTFSETRGTWTVNNFSYAPAQLKRCWCRWIGRSAQQERGGKHHFPNGGGGNAAPPKGGGMASTTQKGMWNGITTYKERGTAQRIRRSRATPKEEGGKQHHPQGGREGYTFSNRIGQHYISSQILNPWERTVSL